MRQFLARLAVVSVAALGLPGCGSGDGRKPLLVYSAHGADILSEFEKLFEAQHPDIDVQTYYDGSARILDRLRGEKRNPRASVWWGGASAEFDAAAIAGLLEPYRPSYATEALAHEPGWLWSACFDLPIVLGYQPDRIRKEDLPRTFEDLAAAKLKGRIILRHPGESGTLRTWVGAMIERAVARGGSEDDGFALLKSIFANVGRIDPKPEIMFESFDNRSEFHLTIWSLTDLAFQRKIRGYHFLPAGLDEPVPVLVDGIALVKGAGTRPEAAAFYEFVNSLESLDLLVQRHARIPARSDYDRAKLLPEVRDVAYRPMKLDLSRLAEKIPGWMKRFDREVLESMGK